ncbi:hypothetical protein H634G_10667 [Metarhizium anisopliae BRIP 53293]|uniref:Uncharacterized protein n=1 Tax=Metarhizium anisopliae BRIP 53293 TaxID=1291518 RepID=A0A0D9NJ35_METAN|nr:hypothetical protein H634G_10667 [Metarhizium anisopliae BRIP 53293]KJK89204.1 hypothetical protein H633G_06927 [Metarhizium anisopliae BRIP 53284]
MAPASKRRRRSNTKRDTPACSESNAHSGPSPESQHDGEHETHSVSVSDHDATLDPTLLDEEVMPEAERALTNTEGAGKGYVLGLGGYNSLKSFNGQYYSGMAVGGSHTWNYEDGVWHEVKAEPDLWKIDYTTNKKRARKAPERSGAPVGTEYHWLIVAHQHVRKVDANTYETHLEGSKYKLAHKGATSNSWSIPTVKRQRERELELLEDAKRRVQGLPPVSGTEKVKGKLMEKGQQKIEQMFGKNGASGTGKRKRN